MHFLAKLTYLFGESRFQELQCFLIDPFTFKRHAARVVDDRRAAFASGMLLDVSRRDWDSGCVRERRRAERYAGQKIGQQNEGEPGSHRRFSAGVSLGNELNILRY